MSSGNGAYSRSVTFLILVVALAAGAVHAAPVASAVTKKGEFALPQDLDGINPKHLIRFEWSDYSGPQTRVAVLPVDNNSQTSSFKISGPSGQVYSYEGFDWNQQVPVNGIEAMITDVMQQSGRFRMVERNVVDEVLSEQNLGDSGRVAKPSAAKIGKILGAQYLVQAVVTSYEPDFSKKKGGLGGITRGLLGGAKVGKSKSLVGLNFRLIDAETSEILFTKQVDVEISSTELGLGGIGWGGSGALGGFFSSASKTPIGQAVMAGCNMGVYELVKQIGNKPAEGSVVKADPNEVFINLGGDAVSEGEVFQAVSKGEELIDPETGLSLGGEEEVIGNLRIVSVKEKYSVAQPQGFDGSELKAGDKVVSTKSAPPLEFAPSWQGPDGLLKR